MKFWGNIGEVFGSEDGNNETDIIIINILKEETKATDLRDYFHLPYFSFHFSLVMLFEGVCCYILSAEGATSSFNSAVTKI